MAKQKKEKTRVKPKLTPEQLAEMGRLPNGHFAKGNKISQVYPDGFFELSVEYFENWIYKSQTLITPDGTQEKENTWLYKFHEDYFTTYGVSFRKVLRSMLQHSPDVYQEYLDIKDTLGEKLIMMASEGKLKEHSIKFYLNAQFKWSEKSETKNENTNTEIKWNETKHYDSE